MAFIDKSALWAVAEESSYGAGATFNITTDLVEFIGPSMDGEIEKIDREVLKNSMVKEKSIPGKETCSGTLPVEVSSAKGVAGSAKVNGDILYKSAMGRRIGDRVSEVPSDSTATTVTVADASVYIVGQAIKLVKGTASHIAIIRAKDTGTDILTFSPACAFTDADTVRGLLSFTINTPQDSTPSLAVQEYIEDGANRYAYTYTGVRISSMGIEFPMANIIKASFSAAGAGFSVSTPSDLTKQCVNVTPQMAKNMVFSYDGTDYDIQTLSLNVESEIYDVEAITTAGLTNKIVTGKSGITGSFAMEFVNTNLFNKFKANTGGELIAKAVATDGKAFGVYAPNVVLNKSAKSIDSAVYKENIDFQCVSSGTCSEDSEDALTIWFEN